jgi:hypothetical protein
MFVVILSLTAFDFSDLNYKMVIFLSQTEGTAKYIFRKEGTVYYLMSIVISY